MDDVKKPDVAAYYRIVPSVHTPERMGQLLEGMRSQHRALHSASPVAGEAAPRSLRLNFESVASRRPEMWAVSPMSDGAGMGITIPGNVDRGLSAGSFNNGNGQTWFSGLYRTMPVGADVQVGVIGGRMMDMIPGANGGPAQRQNDRFMGGPYVNYSAPSGHGVEAKCLESPKDKIRPACSVSYKFRF